MGNCYNLNMTLFAHYMTIDLNEINNHCIMVTLDLIERADVY